MLQTYPVQDPIVAGIEDKIAAWTFLPKGIAFSDLMPVLLFLLMFLFNLRVIEFKYKKCFQKDTLLIICIDLLW